MNSYTDLVTSFLTVLRASPELAARLYNETYPRTLSRREQSAWTPMTAEDAADPDMLEIESMTKAQMQAKLEEQGYDEEMIADQMQGVAIDDSHVLSVFLDVRDPNNPLVVAPCDYAPFAAHCDNEEYLWNDVASWRTVQEFAGQLAADQHILMTMDGGMALSFALPTVVGGRRKRGRTSQRTARRRAAAKKTRKNRRT